MEGAIGDPVSFFDAYGKQHMALVTQRFDGGDPEKYPFPAINVVLVSQDESQKDQYGRQITRYTSVVHKSNQSAHGMYWL